MIVFNIFSGSIHASGDSEFVGMVCLNCDGLLQSNRSQPAFGVKCTTKSRVSGQLGKNWDLFALLSGLVYGNSLVFLFISAINIWSDSCRKDCPNGRITKGSYKIVY